jgi:2-polyprenyl-3-methyl-5-hydroxy-6-metoxy-1,4-benzoquinol methylase
VKLHFNCLICQSENLTILSGYEKAHLCKCADCNFIFSRKIPTNEELNNYYENYGVNQYISPLTIKRYNELLDKFEKFRKTNKILDVGCGIGHFLEEAKKRGWEVYGTELSEKQAEITSSKGIKTFKGVLSAEDFSIQMFDVVTSFEVIEHINNPIQELKILNRIVRNGGVVYITTPNFNSLLRFKLKAAYNIITYPEHLSYYTTKTLEKVFNKSGFKKVKIETTGISVTRFKTSNGTSNQKIISFHSDDEKIRQKIDAKLYLKFFKKIINNSLTLLGKGDTIKGWFVKI